MEEKIAEPEWVSLDVAAAREGETVEMGKELPPPPVAEAIPPSAEVGQNISQKEE